MSRPSLLRKFWDNSQTKILACIQVIGSAILGAVSGINSYVTDPAFKTYLSQIDLPKYAIMGLAVIGMITYVAHGHGDD